jgi:transcription elongation factor Elf1
MTYEEAPACDRHESSVPMQLRTMHSDSSRPEVLVGLFECPECGHERRVPIRTEATEVTAA